MIELIGGYFARSDGTQYVTGKPHTCADGITRMKGARYFPTMEAAARYAVKKTMLEKVEAEEIDTLAGFLRELHAVTAALMGRLEPLDDAPVHIESGASS